MIFKPEKVDQLWDTWLYYHEGIHYLYYLHKSTAGGRWDGISVATFRRRRSFSRDRSGHSKKQASIVDRHRFDLANKRRFRAQFLGIGRWGPKHLHGKVRRSHPLGSPW